MTTIISKKTAASFWTAFWAMVRKEFLIMTRYPVRFVASFGQIFSMVAIFTIASLTFASDDSGQAPTSGLIAYSFLLFMFLVDTLWAIGYNIRQEQRQGTLEQLYLSPASKFANLVSRVVNSLFWTGILCFSSLWLLSALLGRLPFANAPLAIYLFFMTLSGTFGIGFIFAAVTLRLKETSQTLANLLQFTLLIFCAYFFPFSVLPQGIRFVSRLIPLAYGVDAFRSTLMDYPPGFPELAPLHIEIIIVTLFGLLTPFLGYALYRHVEHQARHTSGLSDY